MKLKYTCRWCGATNEITSFWKWFITPHFGVKKYLKCQTCLGKRHFMVRQNWNRHQIWSIDWPKEY